MYGKIINNALTYAPSRLTYNNTTYKPVPDAILEECGWKLIVDSPMPSDAPDFYKYIGSWNDGTETINRVWTLVEFSAEEKVAVYKQLLADSDYEAIKYAEGWLTDEEYAPYKAQREEWREKIRELENGD